jgi:hypothetical protein
LIVKLKPHEKEHYVSNKRLLQEYINWYAEIKEALGEGKEEPQIPPFIVDSMIRIANRLAYRPNFINYTYRDDFIGDALVDCIRFAKNFNPVKGDNPFAYITTICWRAFLRRIDDEQAQKYVKAIIVSDNTLTDFIEHSKIEGDQQITTDYIDFLRDVGYSEDSMPMALKRSIKIKAERLLMIQEDLPNPLKEFEQ